jgi:initiation factor 1A
MPRNNNKNTKKRTVENDERKLYEKNEETEYAIVTKKLGSGRFSVKLNIENKEVMARLCGKFRKGSMKKNNMVDVGSIVLVGIREYEEGAVDIVYVYNAQEVRTLRKNKSIFFEINENETVKEEVQDTFVFEDI